MKYDIIRAPKISKFDKETIIHKFYNNLLKDEDFDNDEIFRELLDLIFENYFKNPIHEKALGRKFLRKFEGLKLICDKLSINLDEQINSFIEKLDILIKIYDSNDLIQGYDKCDLRLKLIEVMCYDAQTIASTILNNINLKNIHDLANDLRVSPFIQKEIDDRRKMELNKIIDLDQEEYKHKALAETEIYTRNSIIIPEGHKLHEKFNRIFKLRAEKSNVLQQANTRGKWADISSIVNLIKEREYKKTQLDNFINKILKPLYYNTKFGKQSFSKLVKDAIGYSLDIMMIDIDQAYIMEVECAIFWIPQINFNSWVNNEELIDLFFDQSVVLNAFKEMKFQDFNKVKQNILSAWRNSSEPKNVNSGDKGEKEKQHTEHNEESEPKNVNSGNEGEKKNVSSSRFSWKVMFPAITLVFATLSIGIFFRKNIYNVTSTILNNSEWLPNSIKPDVIPNVSNMPKLSKIRSMFQDQIRSILK